MSSHFLTDIIIMNRKPFILVSNDDGYQAKGLKSLVEFLSDMADVLVCAPDSGRSGYASAFTVAQPLMLKKKKPVDGAEVWVTNGTPVDCIKLAYDQFCTERVPDLIVSGINHGDNASVNVHYSGTMGAAIEGCLKSIPSIGFSLCDYREDADFTMLRPYIRAIVQQVLTNGLPKGVCLNVNFPLVEELKGMKVCRMNKGMWQKECAKMQHPRGPHYFWMTGEFVSDEPDAEDTDYWALNNGYGAITPTQIDVTAYEALNQLQKWNWEVNR